MENVFIARTEDEIGLCYHAFKALRLNLENREGFIAQVLLQQKQSYSIVAIELDGMVPSAAGFRFANFLAWGKVLYVDDLTTLPEYRGRGFGGRLMDWLIDHAREQGCDSLHLDSGYARHDAHRLYLNKGLVMASHHLAIQF